MNTQRAKDINPPSVEERVRPEMLPEHESHKDGLRKIFPYSVLQKLIAKTPRR